ncbi:MAG: glycosyltransferase family 39 protein [Steroidobacteraceae bacterium]
MKRPPLAASMMLGPVLDLVGYLSAIGVGASPARGQIIGFLVAVAFGYLQLVRARITASGGSWDAALCAHVIIVTLLAFFLRSGAFVLLTSGFGWPGQAAIVIAAVATFAVLRPGYRYCESFSAWNIGGGAGWREVAIGVVVVASALRLIYGAEVELMPEETYYWNYSRHIDIGYLDHPPMVGWLIWLGTAAFGDTEFGVRVGAMGCGVISSLFAYRLTRNLFDEPSALVAVVLLQTLPFFFLAGMLMTPDAPLTAAWIAAVYFLERVLIAGRARAWWGVGLSLGLGMLSKYTIGLLGSSAFLFMLFDASARRWLWRWQPYGAAALALAVFSPVIFWNAHHEWASFAFQTSRRLAERPRFALHKLIASAVVLLTPTGVAAVAVLLGGPAPRVAGEDDPVDRRRAWRFIQCAVLVPLAVFTAFSLRHEVKLDWTGAPWIAAVPALAFGIVHSRSWIRNAWTPTLLSLLVLYGTGLYHLAIGIPGLGYGRHAELIPVGWRELGREIHGIAGAIAKSSGSYPLIVGMDRYAIASELAFYAPDRGEAVRDTSSGHLFGQMGLMYERWFPPMAERGRTLLLVAWSREELADALLQSSVERLGPITEGSVMRGDETIRRYYYRLAYAYRGVAAPP